MSKLRIAVAQLNFLVGDINGNTQIILNSIQNAKQNSVDLLIFPELALSGYPSEDLLLREDFKKQINHALKIIQQECMGITIILGHPDYNSKGIYNAASLIQDNKIINTYHKQYLPNYGVFDERRYFIPGNSDGLFKIQGLCIGILICEDLWYSQPSIALKEKGVQLLICINASPFDYTKENQRLKIIESRIKETTLPILYVHGVSGQDDLVFDGGSQAFDANSHLVAEAGFFKEKLWLIEFNITLTQFISQTILPRLATDEAIYKSLVLSLRDYVNKNHFPGVLIGLSGGMDSALVLTIAVDALGKDRVHAVFLPSRYSSILSQEIVQTLVKKLGVSCNILSIEPSFSAFLTTLDLDSKNPPTNLTIENIQARCRAVLLMALSNQQGNLLLNCSNKSEIAVGYGTLYGDMAGGFSVLKDVSKTRVYQLATYRNNSDDIFPLSLIKRPPTAELAENQKDEDILPLYTQLDPILELYVEQDKSIDDIVQLGFAKETVQQVVHLVNKNEYKRRQLAPGPRISPRGFGRERRYPITSGFLSK